MKNYGIDVCRLHYHLRVLIENEIVDFEFGHGNAQGRPVAVARLNIKEKLNVNAYMVAVGAAWRSKEYAKRWKQLDQCQNEAMESMRGLWSYADPIYPGDWRKAKKSRKQK